MDLIQLMIEGSCGGLDVKSRLNAPFLVMGDFNEILKVEERFVNVSITKVMRDFGDWINNMNLEDLPIMGRKFTQRRGKSCSRLDRVLIGSIWSVKYPNLKLLGLKYSKSNHIPLLLDSFKVN